MAQALVTGFVNSPPPAPPAAKADPARRVAEEFEAIFLSRVLEHMFAGLPTDGPFGGGHAEGIFRSMMNQEYAKSVSRSGGVGIADAVYKEILRAQELRP